MAFSKYVITNAGRNLLLKCMASGDFRIQALVLGSGRYSGILSEIADVVAPEVTFSESQLAVSYRDGQMEISARLTNEQLEQGFAWREYGVYATNGGETVLYCYDNAGEDPVPITAASTGAGISNTIKILMNIDQAATVNVSFEPEKDIVIDDTVTENGANAVSGAAVWSFVHTAGAVPAGSIGAGTLAGRVNANAEAAAELNVAQLRDILLGTAAPEEMVGQVPAGTLYFTYKEV